MLYPLSPLILALLIFGLSACVTGSGSQSGSKLQPADFQGVYLGRAQADPSKKDYLGAEVKIDDFVPLEIRKQLIASEKDLARTLPALAVTIVKELPGPEIAQSRFTYYLLGVNNGPIDYVHYDFDDERNAFERSTITLKGNVLVHRREILVYSKKAGPLSTSNAGFDVVHTYHLDKNVLSLTQDVRRMGSPWTDVFAQDNALERGSRSARFLRVQSLKTKAESAPKYLQFHF